MCTPRRCSVLFSRSESKLVMFSNSLWYSPDIWYPVANLHRSSPWGSWHIRKNREMLLDIVCHTWHSGWKSEYYTHVRSGPWILAWCWRRRPEHMSLLLCASWHTNAILAGRPGLEMRFTGSNWSIIFVASEWVLCSWYGFRMLITRYTEYAIERFYW